MTSEHGMDWLSDAGPVRLNSREEELAEVGEIARLALYNLVRSVFDERAQTEGVTRKDLANSLGSSTALVSRLLLRPSNMTVETAARLLFVLGKDLGFRARGVERSGSDDKFGIPEVEVTPPFPARCDYQDSEAWITPYESGPIRMIYLRGAGDTHDGIYEQLQQTSTPATLEAVKSDFDPPIHGLESPVACLEMGHSQ